MGIQKILIKPNIKLRIINLYKNNSTISKISNEVNISSYSIRDYLKKQNIYDPNNKKLLLKLSPKIKKLYLAGKTAKEISKIFEISDFYVRRVLKDYRIFDPLRDQNIVILNQKQKIYIENNYREKKTVKEISKSLNLSFYKIREYLKKINIYDRQRDNIIKGVKPGTHPKISETKLIKDWDFKKNKIKPEDCTGGSSKKVYWICNKCKLSYKTNIHSRYLLNTGCPYCTGIKVSKYNNLEKLYPKIAKTFHPTKNDKIKPNQIIPGSHKKYWWICENKKHHVYLANPWDRTGRKYKRSDGTVKLGNNCPYCAGRQVWPGESFGDKYPHLLKELDKKQDNRFDIFKISVGSIKKGNWVCFRGHKWRTDLYSRAVNGTGCPRCKKPYSKEQLRIFSELSFIFKNIILEYDRLDIYIPKFKLAFEYDGGFWHKKKRDKDKIKNQIWEKRGVKIIRFRENLKKINLQDVEFSRQTTEILKKILINIALRNAKSLVKFDIKTINKIDKYLKLKKFANEKKYRAMLQDLPHPVFYKSFAALKPTLAKFWDFKKNYPLRPEQISPYISDVVHMKCDKEHTFSRQVNRMAATKFIGCPICSSKVIIEENSFGYKYPELINVFHRTKNKGINLFKIGPTSSKDIYWTCKKNKNHTHKRRAVNKAMQPECPYCSEKWVHKDKNFKKLYPDLVKFWNYQINKKRPYPPFKHLSPENIHLGSHVLVNFICPSCKKDYEYIFREILKKYKRQKIKSIYCKRCNNPWGGVKIKCLNTNEIFNTVSEASKRFGISDPSIHQNINNKSEYANIKKRLKFIKVLN